GLGLASAFALLAPLIARFERDPALVTPLRVAAGIIACYAVYSVMVGSANGLRQFHKQAGLDVTFSRLRAALVVGFAAVGGSVAFALGGFVAAAAAIVVVSSFVIGLQLQPSPSFSTPRFLGFAFQLAIYLTLLNLLMTS